MSQTSPSWATADQLDRYEAEAARRSDPVTVFAADLLPGDEFAIPSTPPYDYDFTGLVETVTKLPDTIETGGYLRDQDAYLITGLVLGKTGREASQWLRLARETVRVTRPVREPLGLGAVVEQSNGWRFVRAHNPGDEKPWVSSATATRLNWADIDVLPVTVIQEGVTA